MSEERIVVPSHALVNSKSINKVMTTLYRKFLGKGVSKKELSKEAGFAPKALGRILAIAHSFGFIEYSRGRKNAKISTIGTEYAHQLTEGDEAKAKEILNTQIDKTALWEKIDEFIEKECAGKHGTISGLGYFLMKTRNKTWQPIYQKTVAEASCDIFSYADKIEYNREEGTFTLKEYQKGMGEKAKTSMREKEGYPPLPKGVAAAGVTLNVTINLDYRMPADLQRDYMKWLQNMAARSSIRFVLKEQKGEEQKD